MKSRYLKPLAFNGFLAIVLIFTSCVTKDDVMPKPTISITPISIESITGQVHGIEAALYSIAVYAKQNDGWYTLPGGHIPLHPISEDNRWVCELGNISIEDFSELAVFLVPNGYEPPILAGENMIPIKMNLVSTSKKLILLK